MTDIDTLSFNTYSLGRNVLQIPYMTETQDRDSWSADTPSGANSGSKSGKTQSRSAGNSVSAVQKSNAIEDEILKLAKNPPAKSEASQIDVLMEKIAHHCADLPLEQRYSFLKSMQRRFEMSKVSPFAVDIFSRQISDIESQMAESRIGRKTDEESYSATDIAEKFRKAVMYKPTGWTRMSIVMRKRLKKIWLPVANSLRKIWQLAIVATKATPKFLFRKFLLVAYPLAFIFLFYETIALGFSGFASTIAGTSIFAYGIICLGHILNSIDTLSDCFDLPRALRTCYSIAGPIMLVIAILFLFNPPINLEDQKSDYVGIIYDQSSADDSKKVLQTVDTRRDSYIGFKVLKLLWGSNNKITWEAIDTNTFVHNFTVESKSESGLVYNVALEFRREVDPSFVSEKDRVISVKDFDDKSIAENVTKLCQLSDVITPETVKKALADVQSVMPYLKLSVVSLKVSAVKTTTVETAEAAVKS